MSTSIHPPAPPNTPPANLRKKPKISAQQIILLISVGIVFASIVSVMIYVIYKSKQSYNL